MVGCLLDGTYRFHYDGRDVGAMCVLGTFSQYAVLSEFSVVKVDDDAADRTVVDQVHRMRLHPSPTAVGVAEPQFEGVLATRVLQHLLDVGFPQRPVVGVHPRDPAVAQLLLHRAPREVEPGLVEPVAPRLRAGRPDHHRGGVRRVAEAALRLLRLPERPAYADVWRETQIRVEFSDPPNQRVLTVPAPPPPPG